MHLLRKLGGRRLLMVAITVLAATAASAPAMAAGEQARTATTAGAAGYHSSCRSDWSGHWHVCLLYEDAGSVRWYRAVGLNDEGRYVHTQLQRSLEYPLDSWGWGSAATDSTTSGVAQACIMNDTTGGHIVCAY